MSETDVEVVPVLGLDAPINRKENELCALIHVERIGREIIVRNDFSFHAPMAKWPMGVAKRAHEYRARVIALKSLANFDDYVRAVVTRVNETPITFIRPDVDAPRIWMMEDVGVVTFADGLDDLRREVAEGRGDRYDALRAAITYLYRPAPPTRIL